jgi:hypothetical protein
MDNFSEAITDNQHGFAAEAFKYCDSVVPEAHAWEVTRSI